jgi:hypothetical protein
VLLRMLAGSLLRSTMAVLRPRSLRLCSQPADCSMLLAESVLWLRPQVVFEQDWTGR